MQEPSSYQILVVGGRTTGLTLACELARHGAPVRIIDKSDGIDPHCRATVLHSRTLEIFQDLGIVDEVLERGTKVRGLSQYVDGQCVLQAPFGDVESPYPWGVSLGQNYTEAILERRLATLGIAVERRTELVDLVQEEDHVRATIRHADGRNEEVLTPWLVGCDGAHSTTRHLNREVFGGEEESHQHVLADVIVDADFERDIAHSFLTDRGVLFFSPIFRRCAKKEKIDCQPGKILDKYLQGRIISRVAASPRLDYPGAFHHLMARGIDRVDIFRDRHDREDFQLRLARGIRDTGSRIHAWALQPNHVHLLSESGAAGVSALMRKVLGGYARAFNRRHGRVGHLFQGRFRSILVEKEAYFLELVRYIHLNPVRAGIVADVNELACYPWTGHSALVGINNRTWQATQTVLDHFHHDRGTARAAYLDFVSAGQGLPHVREFELGRLVRRTRQAIKLEDESKRGRERWAADERVLGSDTFLSAVALRLGLGPLEAGREADFAQLGELLRRTAEGRGIPIAELQNRSQRRPVVRARSIFCRVACRDLGVPVTEVARFLAMTPRAVRYLAGRADEAPRLTDAAE